MVNPDLGILAGRAIRRDYRFTVEDGRLIATGNTAALTDDRRAWIAAHKQLILDALEALPAGCRVTRLCMALGACPDAARLCGAEPARPQREGRAA